MKIDVFSVQLEFVFSGLGEREISHVERQLDATALFNIGINPDLHNELFVLERDETQPKMMFSECVYELCVHRNPADLNRERCRTQMFKDADETLLVGPLLGDDLVTDQHRDNARYLSFSHA